MTVKFYGLKSCDTCRKAEKALRDKGLDVEVVDVRKDGVPRADLERFLDAFNEELINRRSTTWRGLSDDQKSASPLNLLAENPTLMKRPVLDVDGTLYLGWGKDVQASVLG